MTRKNGSPHKLCFVLIFGLLFLLFSQLFLAQVYRLYFDLSVLFPKKSSTTIPVSPSSVTPIVSSTPTPLVALPSLVADQLSPTRVAIFPSSQVIVDLRARITDPSNSDVLIKSYFTIFYNYIDKDGWYKPAGYIPSSPVIISKSGDTIVYSLVNLKPGLYEWGVQSRRWQCSTPLPCEYNGDDDFNVISRIQNFAVRAPNIQPEQKPVLSKPESIPQTEPVFSTSTDKQFRELIFSTYGFTAEAADFIRNNSDIVVQSGDSQGWLPRQRLIRLISFQHEAAVHELSHVWWDYYFKENFPLRKEFLSDVIKLADFYPYFYIVPVPNVASNSPLNFAKVVKFSQEYVYGVGDWKGMFCVENKCVQNVHNILDSEIGTVISDHEIYAGLASFTMGKYKSGPRQLPEFMWKYFEPQFSGNVSVKTYYEGEHR